jgi:uncharacterized membrane protein YfcA
LSCALVYHIQKAQSRGQFFCRTAGLLSCASPVAALALVAIENMERGLIAFPRPEPSATNHENHTASHVEKCVPTLLSWYTFHLHLSQAILLFAAAVCAGTLNAVAGGGTFISFPVLLFTGVLPVQANATNTVALWPGLAASSAAYLKLLDLPRRILVPLLATSVIGGLAGALLLLKTPQHTFLHLVPWLLLGGTLLFTFGNRIRVMAGRDSAAEELQNTSWPMIVGISAFELLVGIYGGYFGAGIGFLALGMLALLGMHDIHAINAVRTLLAAVINASAVLTFILARAVLWPQCVVMIVGALAGGWFAARYVQKLDPRKVRRAVIALGWAMTSYFFVTTR